MHNHILVPTDGSELSNQAIAHAIEFAKAFGAKLTLLNVLEEFYLHIVYEGFEVPDKAALKKKYRESQAATAKRILDPAKQLVVAAGLQCDAVTLTSDSPCEAIIKQARKSKCDLIIMASHGRKGLQALLLGSETVKVLTHSKIPVLVCR